MPGNGSISGLALAEIAAGLILAWSGIENVSIQSVAKSFISGKLPTAGPAVTYATPATATSSTSSAASAGTIGTGAAQPASANAVANQAIARLSVALSHPSWATGQQWSDWVALWTRESGWSSTAWNSSGAYGVAQALGHAGPGEAAVGPRSVGSDEPGLNSSYGGYGLSTSAAIAANKGSPLQQIQWGIAYIAATYGSPSAAWAHEVADSWY